MRNKIDKWKVTWTPIAESDILEIAAYMSETASFELARTLALSIHGAGEDLARNPYLWRARDEILKDVRLAPLQPYFICYRTRDHTIEILRVIHRRRDIFALFAEMESQI